MEGSRFILALDDILSAIRRFIPYEYIGAWKGEKITEPNVTIFYFGEGLDFTFSPALKRFYYYDLVIEIIVVWFGYQKILI